MKKILLTAALLTVFIPACAFAQATQAQQQPSTAAQPTVTAPPQPADWAQRLDLAKKIDTVISARQQVENAVDAASKRLPADQQKEFKDKMLGAIDTKSLEDVSINAMAQTFTLPELQRMADYYGAPEYASIAGKLPVYQQLVRPEIVRMLDKAAMEIRTGAPGETPPVSADTKAPVSESHQ